MGGEWKIRTIEEVSAPSPRSIAMGPFGSNIKTDNFVPSGVPAIDGVCSTDIVVATPSHSHWFELLLGHLSSDEFIAYANAVSTGTKMPRTNWKDMSRHRVTIPPTSIAEAFNYYSRAFIDQIHANIFESHTLAPIRDSLLPKLISGKLCVLDAGKLLERVM